MGLRLKDKQTGDVDEYYLSNDPGYGVVNASTGRFIRFNTLAELNEKFEDATEEKKYGGRVPKRNDRYWYIDAEGNIQSAVWGNIEIHLAGVDEKRFECGSAFWTREEAEKAAKRRKAWTRLEDKGFRFDGWEWDIYTQTVTIRLESSQFEEIISGKLKRDLDLLFGGEE